MKYSYTERFNRSYKKFPKPIQLKFQKQLSFLLENLKHPSLHAKKFNEELGIWQARADRNVRFYFLIENDVYVLLDIKSHGK